MTVAYQPQLPIGWEAWVTEQVEPIDELLTVEDVCSWFKVSKDWIYDEVEAGRLPFVRLGRRHLRFPRSELERYIAANARRSTSRPAADPR